MQLTRSQWDTLEVLASNAMHEIDKRDGGCLLSEIDHPWLVRKYLSLFWKGMAALGVARRETQTQRQARLAFLSFLFRRKIETVKDLNHAEVVAFLSICISDATHGDMVEIWRNFGGTTKSD